MPISTEEYNSYKDALGESKIGDKSAVEVFVEMKERINTLDNNNKDLISQRDVWKEEKNNFKSQFDNLNKSIEDLKSNQVTEDDKKKLNKIKENPRAIEDYNAMAEKLDSLTKQFELMKKEKLEADNLVLQKEKENGIVKARQDFFKKLTTGKDGSNGIDPEFADIMIDKAIKDKKISINEEGNNYNFSLFKNGMELSSSADEVAIDIIKNNERFVKPSGSEGTGQKRYANSTNIPSSNLKPQQQVDIAKQKLLEKWSNKYN